MFHFQNDELCSIRECRAVPDFQNDELCSICGMLILINKQNYYNLLQVSLGLLVDNGLLWCIIEGIS
jgi:hypothetical protein